MRGARSVRAFQYVQKDAKASEGGAEGKFKINFVDVLVPLTVLIPVEHIVVPRLYAGPSLAFELECKLEQSAVGVTVEADRADEGGATKSGPGLLVVRVAIG